MTEPTTTTPTTDNNNIQQSSSSSSNNNNNNNVKVVVEQFDNDDESYDEDDDSGEEEEEEETVEDLKAQLANLQSNYNQLAGNLKKREAQVVQLSQVRERLEGRLAMTKKEEERLVRELRIENRALNERNAEVEASVMNQLNELAIAKEREMEEVLQRQRGLMDEVERLRRVSSVAGSEAGSEIGLPVSDSYEAPKSPKRRQSNASTVDSPPKNSAGRGLRSLGGLFGSRPVESKPPITEVVDGQVQQMYMQIESLEQQLKDSREMQTELERRNESDRQEQMAMVEVLERKFKEKESTILKQKEKIVFLQDELKEVKDGSYSGISQSDYDKLLIEKSSLEQDAMEQSKQIQELESQLKRLTKAVNEATTANDALAEKLTGIEEEKEALLSQVDEFEAQKSNTSEQSEKKYKVLINSLTEDKVKIEKELAKMNELYQQQMDSLQKSEHEKDKALEDSIHKASKLEAHLEELRIAHAEKDTSNGEMSSALELKSAKIADLEEKMKFVIIALEESKSSEKLTTDELESLKKEYEISKKLNDSIPVLQSQLRVIQEEKISQEQILLDLRHENEKSNTSKGEMTSVLESKSAKIADLEEKMKFVIVALEESKLSGKLATEELESIRKEYEISKQLNGSIPALQSQLQAIQIENESKDKLLVDLRASLEDSEAKQRELEENLKILVVTYEETKLSKQQIEETLAVLQCEHEKMKESIDTIPSLRNALAISDQNCHSLSTENVTLKNALAAEKKQVADLTSEVNSLNDNKSMNCQKASMGEEELREIQFQLLSKTDQLSEQQEKVKLLIVSLEETKLSKQRLSEEVANLKRTFKQRSSGVQSAGEELEDTKKQLKATYAIVEELKRRNASLLKEIDEFEDTTTINDVRNRLLKTEEALTLLETDNETIRATQEKAISSLRQVTDAASDLTQMEVEYIQQLAVIEKERDALQDVLDTKISEKNKMISSLRRSVTAKDKKLSVAEAEILQLKSNSYNKTTLDRSQSDVTIGQATTESSDSKAKKLEETYIQKIQVKDHEIAVLQRQQAEHTKQVAFLQRALNEMNINVDGGDVPAFELLEKLRQESELFASQIIEQEEELGNITNALDEQRKLNESLQTQLTELKDGRSLTLASDKELEVALDEQRKLNESLQTQLTESKDGRSLTLASDKELEVERKRNNKLLEEVEVLRQQVDSLNKKKGASTDMRIFEQEEEIADLSRALRDNKTINDNLQNEVDELRKSFEEEKKRNNKLEEQQADVKPAMQKYIDQYKKENELLLEEVRSLKVKIAELDNESQTKGTSITQLERQLNKLQKQIKSGEIPQNGGNLPTDVSELQTKLVESEAARQDFEKNAIANFDRRIVLLKLDHNVAMDKLRKTIKDLSIAQEAREEELLEQIKSLERMKRSVTDELKGEVKKRENKIARLEADLTKQRQKLKDLSSEMHQLRSSMSGMNDARKNELEDLQQELMDSASKLTRQEREIKNLKMAIEENRRRHVQELSVLVDHIEKLEEQQLKNDAVACSPSQKEQENDGVTGDISRLEDEEEIEDGNDNNDDKEKVDNSLNDLVLDEEQHGKHDDDDRRRDTIASF